MIRLTASCNGLKRPAVSVRRIRNVFPGSVVSSEAVPVVGACGGGCRPEESVEELPATGSPTVPGFCQTCRLELKRQRC